MIRMFALACCLACTAQALESLPVAKVWAGHPVRFALLTAPPHQYIGFYDAERQLTVAQRTLESDTWTLQPLDERVGWDSHNSIVMTRDADGHLHLTANMHGDPLVYFRTTAPDDVTTFARVSEMVGRDEQRCTYPEFLRGPNGQLIFTYRSGSSGDGIQIYNVYDRETQTWSRLLDTPLVDGEGQRNAYLDGPRLGPDGWYHLVWVWRDTPDCATNHSLSYARSRDLVQWERSDGTPLALPITFDTCEVVDPVPPGGGLINGNAKLGFDHEHRAVIAYHKYDAEGATQLYNAGREADGWRSYQTSDWSYRWAFSGGGSIPFEIRVRAVQPAGEGRLMQAFEHAVEGDGRWLLDTGTLRPVEQLDPAPRPLPDRVYSVRSPFPGMGVRIAGDTGRAPGERYYLRWETLGANRDRPREKPWPEPGMLELLRHAR